MSLTVRVHIRHVLVKNSPPNVDCAAEPITSVQQTRDGSAVLVSSLDSTIRLMDKSNGQLLQSYKGHTNKDFRIRSCLGLNDGVVISGSEDGRIYVWDMEGGQIMETLLAHNGKVASTVAYNSAKKEWASAGADGWLILLYDCCLSLLIDAQVPPSSGDSFETDICNIHIGNPGRFWDGEKGHLRGHKRLRHFFRFFPFFSCNNISCYKKLYRNQICSNSILIRRMLSPYRHANEY